MTCRQTNIGSKNVILNSGGYMNTTPNIPSDMYRIKIEL